VPDTWQQGRGSWGGLPIGAMVRAVALTEPDPARTVRTVSLQLIAPALVGDHEVQVEPARIGSGVSTWTVRVVDTAHATVALGSIITAAPRASAADRDERAWSALTAPAALPWTSVPIAQTPPPFPTFTQHLDFRVTSGIPLSGSTPETTGWIDYRMPTPRTDASLLALVDAWYTVTIVAMTELLPISTVNFTASLLVDPATLDPDEPLLHHGLISAAHGGFASEQRRLWTSDGRLVVDNLQTLVVG
jgi:Thioesterase-like superfamily